MEEEGVEILTCGTCLKHYGLMDKLQVGKVTDMYTIAERMDGGRQDYPPVVNLIPVWNDERAKRGTCKQGPYNFTGQY